MNSFKYIAGRYKNLSMALLMSLPILTGCASSDSAVMTDASNTDTAVDESVDEVVSTATPQRGVICKMRRVTGSHIARQQCFTKQEKENLEQASKTLLRTGGSRGGAYRIPSHVDPRDQ